MHTQSRGEEDVTLLIHKLSVAVTSDEYRNQQEHVLWNQPHCPDLPTEENRKVLQSCIVAVQGQGGVDQESGHGRRSSG